MKKNLLTGLVVLCLITLVSTSYAGIVIQSAGTQQGIVEKINFTGGPTVTVTNKTAAVNTGDVSGILTVSDDIYAEDDMFIDGAIYMRGAAGGNTLWMTQPDGGCSACDVDDAGTTFACTDETCPAYMVE